MTNPFAIAGALEMTYGVLAIVFAVVVYNVEAKNPVNRCLALLLLVDGATSGGLVLGISRFVGDPMLENALTAVAYFGNGARPFLYLAFIMTAMPFAWTRWFDNSRGRQSLWALAILAGLATGFFGLAYPILKNSLQATFIVVGLIGFFSAVLAYKRATGDRQRTKAYLSAFAVRDVGAALLLPIRDLAEQGGMLHGWTLVAVKIIYVIFILLVVYGVLWGQIVDLDAKARATIGRTAAATIVAIIFVVVTESVEGILGVEDPLIGLTVSVLVAFSFQPIESWVESRATAFFPGRATQQ